MDRTIINPWTWQDQFGFVQANLLQGVGRMLVCAGQISADANGELLHAGDMRAQLQQALENLETVLKQAGLELKDVVRLNYYTTDVDAFIQVGLEVLGSRLGQAGCRPASTLLGVTRLAFPGQVIELEATAAS